jgi:outer membrane immunogenic protein
MKNFPKVVVLFVVFPSVAPAQDWTGFYGGLSASTVQGDVTAMPGGVPVFDIDGSQPGVFLGYGLQKGSIVYGGELAYASGDIDLTGVPGQGIDRFVDLKGRVGYAAGSALYYGVVGYSTDRIYAGPGATATGSGMSYGLGVDVQFKDRFILGAEYLHRNMDSDLTAGVVATDVDVDSFSLRLGMKF